MNPFTRIKPIQDANKFIDMAFRRASKVEPSLPQKLPPLLKAKKREEARVRKVAQFLHDRFNNIVKQFPKINDLHPFYRDLTDVLVGVDNLKKYLASLRGAAKVIMKIANEHIRNIRRATDPNEAAKERKAAYGRIASFVKKLDERLIFLEDARSKLKRLPSIDPDMPTIVVAGPPNVGKSTLVRVVSTAKPEIATYPFTTKTLILGHFKADNKKYQILDTPGLLDRPLGERNKIELQAIMALRHVASIIVFMVDPSETCGYSLDMQLSIYEDIKESFNIPIIPTINKVDISAPEMIEKAKNVVGDDAIEMAAIKGLGIKELMERFQSFLEKEAL